MILKHCLILPQSRGNSTFAACLSALIVMIKKKCCLVHCFCWGGRSSSSSTPHLLYSPVWCYIDKTNSFCYVGFTVTIRRIWKYSLRGYKATEKLRINVISKVNPNTNNENLHICTTNSNSAWKMFVNCKSLIWNASNNTMHLHTARCAFAVLWIAWVLCVCMSAAQSALEMRRSYSNSEFPGKLPCKEARTSTNW